MRPADYRVSTHLWCADLDLSSIGHGGSTSSFCTLCLCSDCSVGDDRLGRCRVAVQQRKNVVFGFAGNEIGGNPTLLRTGVKRQESLLATTSEPFLDGGPGGVDAPLQVPRHHRWPRPAVYINTYAGTYTTSTHAVFGSRVCAPVQQHVHHCRVTLGGSHVQGRSCGLQPKRRRACRKM